MNIMTMLPVMMAINNSRRLMEEENEEKQKKQEESFTYSLLLEGDNEFMEIGKMETVKSTRILYDADAYRESAWTVYIEEEKIKKGSFNDCLQEIIQKYNPVRFQIIPYSVDNKYHLVDAYRVIMVINEAQKLQSLADKMSEDIKTSW